MHEVGQSMCLASTDPVPAASNLTPQNLYFVSQHALSHLMHAHHRPFLPARAHCPLPVAMLPAPASRTWSRTTRVTAAAGCCPPGPPSSSPTRPGACVWQERGTSQQRASEPTVPTGITWTGSLPPLLPLDG